MVEHLNALHLELLARMNAAEPSSEKTLAIGDLIMATNMLALTVKKFEEQEEKVEARKKAAAQIKATASKPAPTAPEKRTAW